MHGAVDRAPRGPQFDSPRSTEHEIDEAWFAMPRPSSRPSKAPGPPIGDAMADEWFK